MADPPARWGHYSVDVQGFIHVWGGRTKDFSQNKSDVGSTLFTFDPFKETWQDSQRLKGSPPPGLYFGAWAAVGRCIYFYGGYDGSHSNGTFHRLDLESSSWSRLPDGPMRLSGAMMVYYESAGKLVLFGGYGFNPTVTQEGDTKKYCRYDVLYTFDLGTEEWSTPKVSGDVPSPRNRATLTMIDDHHAVLFGGRQDQQRSSGTFILDLAKMHWTRMAHYKGMPWPTGRSSHAATCVGHRSHQPQLVVVGGVDNDCNVLGDVWMLDFESRQWKEVKIPKFLKRESHSATAVALTQELEKIIMFGGICEWPENALSGADYPQISETCVLTFEYSTKQKGWSMVDMASDKSLGTSERVVERRTTPSDLVSNSVTKAEYESIVMAEKEKSDKRVQEAEEACERRVQEAEDRARECERTAQAAEERAQELERRCSELQHSNRLLEGSLTDARKTVDDFRNQWAVERSEVHMTEEVLGKGGWGEVKVALFRGARVAAKLLYHELQYEYYRDLFAREMNMASRIRHPNLVQFIGATIGGEMLILTELMPVNLRNHIKTAQPSHSFTCSVALDTAKGLNYLHLMKPDPIIHRDISSANVLLEPLSDNKWRAKISDYGSVNFQQQLKTVGPGNPVYAAPETHDPTNQTPKMDIFSFGVLLIEICTCRFPELSARERLIESIEDEQWLRLVRQCLNQDKEQRPSAYNIVTELRQ